MANFGQNGDKHGPREKVDVIGGSGPIGQRQTAPHGRCPVPHWHLPCHWSVGVAPKPITSLHSSWSDQRTRFDAGGFMGPLSYTWEPPIDLPTDLPSKFHHMLSSQLPWSSNQHPWMLRRCIQGLAGALLPPPGVLGCPPTLPLPTNTPHLTIHHK